MTIAVSGATGWIGTRVVDELRSRGLKVRRFVRNATQPDDCVWALERPSRTWAEHLSGCDAVIHCAGRVHISEEYNGGDIAEFRRINRDGTDHLIMAATAAGTKRFVLASTIAVYDWAQRRPMAETDATAPMTAYARSKLEAEACLRRSNIDWRICRLATVFGDGDTANFARLAAAIRRRHFFLPGDGTAMKSVLPLEIASSVLVQAACDEKWARTTVNVAMPVAPSLSEICAAFSAVCGMPQVRHIPIAAVRGAAMIGSVLARFGVRLPFTCQTLSKLTTNTVVVTNQLNRLIPVRQWPNFAATLAHHASYYSQL